MTVDAPTRLGGFRMWSPRPRSPGGPQAEYGAFNRRHTAEIVRLETALNGRVYGLFGLSAAEVGVEEAATKYAYGAV